MWNSEALERERRSTVSTKASETIGSHINQSELASYSSDSGSSGDSAAEPEPRQSESTPKGLQPHTRISRENLNEAEQLLLKMNPPALLQLKRLLRGKVEAIRKDYDILQHNQNTLLDFKTKLTEEKDLLEKEKVDKAKVLTIMRDNLCEVSDFNCKTFEIQNDVVLESSSQDQWKEKGDMLVKMEEQTRKDMKEDNLIANKCDESEREWRKMMMDYMRFEEEIINSKSRLQDLKLQAENYEKMTQKQQAQLQNFRERATAKSGQPSKHSGNILVLRNKITEPLVEEYNPEYLQRMIDDFDEYTRSCDEELAEMQTLVTEVEATDDIRQHALELALEAAHHSEYRGIESEIWAEMVRTSIKASVAGLKTKIQDIYDMSSFKEQALDEELQENKQLKTLAGLGLPDRYLPKVENRTDGL